jgi:hypothetical protein
MPLDATLKTAFVVNELVGPFFIVLFGRKKRWNISGW